MIYDSAGSLRVTSFLRAGQDRGEAILAVVPSRVERVAGGRPMSADPGRGHRNESDDRARATLQHDAYTYDDADGYVTDLLGFVRGGLARDEPALIAVPGPNLELLHTGLSVQEAAQVRMHDMAVSGRNPGRILGSVLTAFVHEHPGHRVRIISETIWPDRTDEEYLACVEHEALINIALTRHPAHIVCPYNRTSLPPPVLADAARTHPTLAWAATAATVRPTVIPAPWPPPLTRRCPPCPTTPRWS